MIAFLKSYKYIFFKSSKSKDRFFQLPFELKPSFLYIQETNIIVPGNYADVFSGY